MKMHEITHIKAEAQFSYWFALEHSYDTLRVGAKE
jgi:hypothetical protein